MRRAAERLELRVLDGDAGPSALAAFDRLHRCNLAKYRHALNHCPPAAVRAMAEAPGFRLFLRFVRGDPEPVQGILGRIDGRRLELLVQGIDEARVPPGVNVYATSMYEIYAWGVQRGVELFDLGRGAPQLKLSLGANAFRQLDNHLAPRDTDGLERLRAAADAEARRGVAELAATVRRRGAERLVELP